MEAIARGDRHALATLYDLHAPQSYAVALRILRCEADAEAVVSDVFLEIWQKSDQFDQSLGSVRTYLLMMARSRAIDRLRAAATRRQKTAEAGPLHAEAGNVRQQAESPCESAIAVERRRLVREALAGLRDQQQEPLLLAFFEGLTHREIADRLGEPLGTVKTRIRAGLQKLRGALGSIGRETGSEINREATPEGDNAV